MIERSDLYTHAFESQTLKPDIRLYFRLAAFDAEKATPERKLERYRLTSPSKLTDE